MHICRKIADGMIVATPKLKEQYAHLNDNIHVCRNAIDPADWPSLPPHQPDGVLRIGWAGSASHKYDLADIRLALDWASRQSQVEIVLAGFEDILGSLLSLPNVKWIPWTTRLSTYRAGLSEIDVMLAPNRRGAWADAKSDIKALEAAMAGACSVVADSPSFSEIVNGEFPGYVAKTPKDFLKVVKHLVANRDEVAEAAQLAKDYVMAKRNIQTSVQEWRDAIES